MSEMPEAVSTFNRKEYEQKYYQLHRERILARNQRHYLNNKERIKARFLEWKQKNSEKYRARSSRGSKRYRVNHKERVAALCAKYYRKHREQLLAYKSIYNKRRYSLQRDKLLADGRRYQAANKEKVRAQQKQYREINFRERARTNKAWREKNPNWIRNYHKANPHIVLMAAAKRRALKRGAEIDMLEIKEWMIRVKSSPAFRCYYCDGTFSTLDVHFDHVLSLTRFKIHKIGNLCTACSACNLSKGAKLPSEWIKHGQLIFDI